MLNYFAIRYSKKIIERGLQTDHAILELRVVFNIVLIVNELL
ncbi:hypothetical protein MNBD_ALPHA11-247 [hydrothermal vent metagenome]|uniref:Uncharacterized protein n=1 Tax=hydrothermal vent metagenome TaxID=652676 RepID=A0A3B0U3K1_9ZZZZ